MFSMCGSRKEQSEMYHVPFVCPDCECSELAPLSGVIKGDAGVWVCEGCGSTYQINIEFSRIYAPLQNYIANRISAHRFAPEVN